MRPRATARATRTTGARGGRAWSVAAALVLTAGALAFGSVYPWAYWPLLAACAALGTIGLVRWSHPGSSARTLSRLSLSLALTLLAISIQLTPLPASWLSRISPSTDAFLTRFDVSYATSRATADTAGPGPRHPLSVHPARTLVGALFFVALSVYLLGACLVLGRTGSVSLARGIGIAGVLVAFVGIVQKAAYSGRIYGFWTPEGPGDVFGPFVNHNHFAGWIVMVLSLAAGQFCGRLAGAMRGVKAGWRQQLRWWSTPQASELTLAGFALVVMAVALVWSMSRSGLTCWLVAVVIAGWFAARRIAGTVRRRFAVVYLGLATIAAMGWIGIDRVAARFAAASWSDVGGRLGPWRDALNVVRDFPLAGSGLNTYGDVMLLYQRYNPALHYTAAHNDYLQLAAEGGLLLVVPALATIAVFGREIRRRFAAGHDDEIAYWIRLGSVTGLLAIGLQSVVDFSLQMPANAMLCATLAAVALHEGRTTVVDGP